MSDLTFSGSKVADAATRDSPPAANEEGLVVRPLGSGPGGSTVVVPEPSATADLVAIPASLVAVLLLAANALRLGFSIFNTSATDTLYIKASTSVGVVSPTFFTVAIPPRSYYEDPYRWVGDVFGVWDPAATGTALVDEYEP